MKKHLTILFGMLLAAVTVSTTRADTTVKILHLQDNPKYLEVWKQIGAEFEKQNPGVKIDWQFLENEAFKAKLPTTLQSKERPDLFYSWAGGVFFDQARAGVLKDITTFMQGEWADSLSPAGVKAFTYDGKVYGAPMKTSLEILWYNKALLEKAGVDPASLGTWKGFLEAVKKCKASGITPLATGGGDKWPLHFYWTMLALRIGGQEAFESAFNRTGEGFDSPTFVKAGEMFKELIDLQPFQPGFLYLTTQVMLTVLKMGGFTTGGLNFDAKVRRESFEPIDLFFAHIGGMDAFARGLKIAAAIRADGRLAELVKNRYASWDRGIGSSIEAGQEGFASLEEYTLSRPDPVQHGSGRQELFENIVNELI